MIELTADSRVLILGLAAAVEKIATCSQDGKPVKGEARLAARRRGPPRLPCGRNDPCPCGCGRKAKKCQKRKGEDADRR